MMRRAAQSPPPVSCWGDQPPQPQTLEGLKDNPDAPFLCPNCDDDHWTGEWSRVRDVALETHHRAAPAGSEGAAAAGGG